MRTLTDLKKHFKYPLQVPELTLGDLHTDSRLIKKNDVFLALKGEHVNGADYVFEAKKRGACAVVVPSGNRLDAETVDLLEIPVLTLSPGMSVATFAAWFYEKPSARLKVIGVTGTNGKTTTTQLIAQWLTLCGRKAAVLGTLGWGYLPKLHKSANTTLDAVSLQRIFASLVREGTEYAVMEVSSIGVCEGRIEEVRFEAGGFTNLTRDHLDYHGDMQHYAEAKERFLSMIPPQKLSINGDCEEGIKCIHLFQQCCVYSKERSIAELTSMSQSNAFVEVRKVGYEQQGLSLDLNTHRGQGNARLRLMGAFNVENFACALCIMLSLGFALPALLKFSEQLRPVTGRMECFNAPDKPQLVVDYAHTPDGVQQVLQAVRAHHRNGRIWCVIGCGGDRDRGKRPQMAMKASVYADEVILTSDNPRSEDPQAIIDDMLLGVRKAENVKVEPDRTRAIEQAFGEAGPQDVVVIAGKGHEDYQILKDKTVHFSDREIAARLLGVEIDQF